jgi:hypothetical protein
MVDEATGQTPTPILGPSRHVFNVTHHAATVDELLLDQQGCRRRNLILDQ